MKKLKVARFRMAVAAGFCGLALLLTGCIASLYPLYTEKDLVFEKDLIGSWKSKEGKEESKECWIFTKRDATSYDVAVQAGDGDADQLIARLVKLEGHLFMDATLNEKTLEESKVPFFSRLSIIPGHIIFQVDSVAPLKIRMLQGDWVRELIEKDPKAVSHIKFESDPKLAITAGTPELQQFVLKHRKDADAWGNAAEFVRSNSIGLNGAGRGGRVAAGK